MSICRIKTIQFIRNGRYMLTTDDGEVFTTPKTPSGIIGVKAVAAAMTGPFWASIELDEDGHLATLEGIEF